MNHYFRMTIFTFHNTYTMNVLIALIVVNVLISYKGFNDISFLNMSFMWERAQW
jgi:hypothetical protein